jgi:hypothetical protein
MLGEVVAVVDRRCCRKMGVVAEEVEPRRCLEVVVLRQTGSA